MYHFDNNGIPPTFLISLQIITLINLKFLFRLSYMQQKAFIPLK